jgi:hypothetical protein
MTVNIIVYLVTIDGFGLAICLLHTCNLELQAVMYNAVQITITHTSHLSLLQPPLFVTWLQSSNKGHSSPPYGSRTALHNR